MHVGTYISCVRGRSRSLILASNSDRGTVPDLTVATPWTLVQDHSTSTPVLFPVPVPALSSAPGLAFSCDTASGRDSDLHEDGTNVSIKINLGYTPG
ncbi:hypothetical protein EVAR_58770_1 [Eumeta japonica]|uniref:Uncharacterized protein n=1 Tax=Eumeta variegata TaxID=151549 RepID=A0A4C1ZWG8_EUMVA|nr:hypothetical protein EVAR_58770_1 [Eumeta japonica]